ncbi:hypothetical protein [Clostridium nigeriense]|uniref:hypothetical protein n=1 Tax=Clostridium nigeriense TaxID=1805470 RepID=UPI0008301B90|nr:hypothetical protein [Clostridium nigeriense]
MLKYEFKKVFSKISVIILINLGIILNLSLFLISQSTFSKNFIFKESAYEEYLGNIKNADIEEAKSIIEKEIQEKSNYYLLFTDSNEFDEKLIEIKNNLDVNRYKNSKELDEDLILLNYIKENINYINSYDEFLNNVKSNKDKMLKFSIFNKKGSFSYNNIIKTANDFEKMEGLNLSLIYGKGVEAIMEYKIVDIISMVLVFLLSFYIFQYERDKGLLNLIKANKNGRKKTIVSKIYLHIITITILSIILYGGIFMLSKFLFGFGNLKVPLQSLEIFKTSILNINLDGFLILYFIYKIIINIFIGLFIAYMFTKVKNTMKVILYTIAIFLISIITYNILPEISSLNFFKYINLYSYLNAYNILGNYINISIFNRAISLKEFTLISLGVLIPLFIWINIHIYMNKEENKNDFNKNILVINRFTDKIFSTVKITFFETYKLFILNKGIIILLILLFIGLNKIKDNYYFIDINKGVYLNYINKFNGELTEEKEKAILKEKYTFDNYSEIYSDLSKKLKNNEISEEEYNIQILELDDILKNYLGFSIFFNQYLNIKNTEVNNKYLLNELSARNLFLNTNTSLNLGILAALALIITVNSIFSYDYRNNSIKLIRTTLKGRKDIFKSKFSLNIILSLIVSIFTILPIYFQTKNMLGINYLEANIKNISFYQNINLNLNTLQFLFLNLLFRVIGFILISLIIMLISIYLKDTIKSIILSAIIILLPLIIEFKGITTLRFLSFNNVFLSFNSFSFTNGCIKNFIYYSLSLLLIMLISIFSYKKYVITEG